MSFSASNLDCSKLVLTCNMLVLTQNNRTGILCIWKQLFTLDQRQEFNCLTDSSDPPPIAIDSDSALDLDC
jgi:hypothetical protein